MEETKQSGSSCTSGPFGAKYSSAAASSSGYFSSIFDPPPKVTGWESSYFSAIEKKNESGTQSSAVKTGVVLDKNNVIGDSQTQDKSSTGMNLYNQEEKVQPFHYSSSLYYGGQDVYSRPQDAQNPGPTMFKKEGKEDDSDSASRGNWWQGSLYY